MAVNLDDTCEGLSSRNNPKRTTVWITHLISVP